jgi:transposase
MNTKVTLNMKEIKRIKVIEEIKQGRMTAKEAGRVLGISIRQVRRLIKKQREEGDIGLIHGNRGKPSPRKVDEGIRKIIVELIKAQYRDYNDCHLQETMEEEHHISISRSTLRNIRRSEGLSSPRQRRAPKHRQRRPRKAQFGAMLQTDGSDHDWLEGRGSKLTLISYIDDASGQVVWAGFRQEEDAAGYFLGLEHISHTQGIPLSIYADRHMIFQGHDKAGIEDELEDRLPKSQFGRLCEDLGIELIPAYSPQAKGRVERLFQTLQDRLTKALRKARVCTLEQANQVLMDFLPRFNQRFSVKPADSTSMFLPWPKQYRRKDHFCFKYQRLVSNDNTISFNNFRLQIPPSSKRLSFAKTKVDLHHHLDGSLEILYQEFRLALFQPLHSGPPRVNVFIPHPNHLLAGRPIAQVSPLSLSPRQPARPAADHPWRQYPAVFNNQNKTAQSSLNSSRPPDGLSEL